MKFLAKPFMEFFGVGLNNIYITFRLPDSCNSQSTRLRFCSWLTGSLFLRSSSTTSLWFILRASFCKITSTKSYNIKHTWSTYIICTTLISENHPQVAIKFNIPNFYLYWYILFQSVYIITKICHLSPIHSYIYSKHLSFRHPIF